MEKFERFLYNAFNDAEIARKSFDVYGVTFSRLNSWQSIIDQNMNLSELGEPNLVTSDIVKFSKSKNTGPKEINCLQRSI